MIRDVRIESGKHSIKVSLDKNLYFKNTWTRLEGDSSVCPESGTWRYGTGYNKHYLYLIDKNDESILLLSDIGLKGSRQNGLGQFLSTKLAIARDVLLSWKIVNEEGEWTDNF